MAFAPARCICIADRLNMELETELQLPRDGSAVGRPNVLLMHGKRATLPEFLRWMRAG